MSIPKQFQLLKNEKQTFKVNPLGQGLSMKVGPGLTKTARMQVAPTSGFFDQASTSEGPTLIRPGSANYNPAQGFARAPFGHHLGGAGGSLTSRPRPHPNCRRSFGTELTNLQHPFGTNPAAFHAACPGPTLHHQQQFKGDASSVQAPAAGQHQTLIPNFYPSQPQANQGGKSEAMVDGSLPASFAATAT